MYSAIQQHRGYWGFGLVFLMIFSVATPAVSGKAGNSAGKAKAKSVTTARTSEKLDKEKIHAVYLEGDFDMAVKSMEASLKSPGALSHADSVFIFKHLGVIYAARPETRDKGRQYMHQLIDIEPTAKILDMYASDMIYLIFRNVQEDVEEKRQLVGGASIDSEQVISAQVAPPASDTIVPEPGRSRNVYWVAGGAIAAVGVGGLLYVLLDAPSTQSKSIVIRE